MIACRLKSVIPYGTVILTSWQASHWEQSMRANLLLMADQGAKAVALETAAGRDADIAQQTMDEASMHQTEGQALEAKGDEYLAKSDRDAALAAGQEEEAEEWQGKAVQDETETKLLTAEAAVEEKLIQDEIAEAAVDAGVATSDELEANTDEVAVGFCQWVPFVDVVCDVVGGVMAVGLEMAAADESGKAASELADAAATAIDKDKKLAKASELQSKAVEDEAMATESQAAATKYEERAEEERAKGEAEETAGKEKVEQGALEEEVAEEEEAEAAEELEQSTASWSKSVDFGVAACWDAIMAGVVSLLALGFVGVRLLVPLIVMATKAMFVQAIPATVGGNPIFTMRDMSLAFHHCFMFGLVFGLLGARLIAIDELDTRSRGGIILLFALTAACAQALLLHALPKVSFWTLNGTTSWQALTCHVLVQVGWTVVRSLLFLCPLFTLEILILWINFRHGVFSTEMVGAWNQRYLWVAFAFTLLGHYWYLERPDDCQQEPIEACSMAESQHLLNGKENGTAHISYQSSDDQSSSADWSAIGINISNETDVYDLRGLQLGQGSERPVHHKGERSTLDELRMLQFPFEVLMASILVALLRSCVPSFLRVWPASKHLIVASHFQWHHVLLCLVGALAVATLIVYWFRRSHATRTQL